MTHICKHCKRPVVPGVGMPRHGITGNHWDCEKKAEAEKERKVRMIRVGVLREMLAQGKTPEQIIGFLFYGEQG